MTNTKTITYKTFFIKDRDFYHDFARLVITMAAQNLVAYSVNMLDNIMLGNYSQDALSGATIVNQIFFVIQQLTIAVGQSLVAISSQYWGKHETDPIRRLSWIVLRVMMVLALIVFALCTFFPEGLLRLFTTSDVILQEGLIYLSIVKYSFIFFMLSSCVMAMLRSVETVRIALVISTVSLVVNGCINYTLIFGNFNAPKLGIFGAGIGTLLARIIELAIVLFYVAALDKKLDFFGQFKKFRKKESSKESADGSWVSNRELMHVYASISLPLITSGMIWAITVPMQTAILGHVSDDAIAANSVSSTFFQYLKFIVVAISSSNAVMIGKAIGRGHIDEVKATGRTLAFIAPCVGTVLGIILFSFRLILLSAYNLTDTALTLANHFIIIMSIVMVFMSYQMPLSSGVLEGSGDSRFCLIMNTISTWLILMPLSFLAAFYWRFSPEIVVLFIQSDQIYKGLPLTLRFRSYKWIHKLTK